jgi:hypothetical protein
MLAYFPSLVGSAALGRGLGANTAVTAADSALAPAMTTTSSPSSASRPVDQTYSVTFAPPVTSPGYFAVFCKEPDPRRRNREDVAQTRPAPGS